MNTNRPLVRLAALGTAASLTLVAGPALAAKPVKPGAVSNLTFTVAAPAYHLASTWSAGKNATAYQVRLSNAAGTVLDNEQVSTLSWSFDVPTSKAPLGSTLRLSVTSLNGKQKSAAVSRSLVMPDVTAPSGTYSATSSGHVATLTQDSLADDSGTAGVTRSVHWGDGTAATSWASGSTIQHRYAAKGSYDGFVRLRDAAGNTYDAPFTVDIQDSTPPTGGTYTSSSAVYQGTITQLSAPVDDFDGADVQRSVSWGDGSNDTVWAPGTGTVSHPFKAQGTYDAVVHVSDSSGNTTDVKVPVVIKDSTGPQGAYAGSSKEKLGTITETTAPSDDFGGPVTRTVFWGDAQNETGQAWSAGSTITHPYTAQGRYLAYVLLSDQSGNTTKVSTPIVIDDTLAPKATYSLPTRAWASFTTVTLTQTAGYANGWVDDFSPNGYVKRTVAWGDGTQTSGLADATSLTHRYSAAGTYTPTVTLTDESGNTATITANAIVVRRDTTAPKVTVTLPTRSRNFVKKWGTLRGTAIDAGVGVRKVRLQVVEKRGSTYYAYKFATKRWVKAGTRIGQAWRKAGVVGLRTSTRHTWSRSVAGLRRGVLTYRVDGIDRMGNTSKWLVHSQKLTR